MIDGLQARRRRIGPGIRRTPKTRTYCPILSRLTWGGTNDFQLLTNGYPSAPMFQADLGTCRSSMEATKRRELDAEGRRTLLFITLVSFGLSARVQGTIGHQLGNKGSSGGPVLAIQIPEPSSPALLAFDLLSVGALAVPRSRGGHESAMTSSGAFDPVGCAGTASVNSQRRRSLDNS